MLEWIELGITSYFTLEMLIKMVATGSALVDMYSQHRETVTQASLGRLGIYQSLGTGLIVQ